jgi:hypothetical protein
MTKADVQKIWKTGDQTLLLNEIRLRGLDFEPDEDWIAVQLPKLTGHTPADLPLAAAKLRSMIPTPPDPDQVAKEAPDLLTKAKDAAQKRSEKDLAPLVSADMMANKARIYDMFDITNFRAYSLGKYSTEDNGTVGVQFFELTTSNVERLYYVQLGNSHGRLVIRDVITGPDVADRFLGRPFVARPPAGSGLGDDFGAARSGVDPRRREDQLPHQRQQKSRILCRFRAHWK